MAIEKPGAPCLSLSAVQPRRKLTRADWSRRTKKGHSAAADEGVLPNEAMTLGATACRLLCGPGPSQRAHICSLQMAILGGVIGGSQAASRAFPFLDQAQSPAVTRPTPGPLGIAPLEFCQWLSVPSVWLVLVSSSSSRATIQVPTFAVSVPKKPFGDQPFNGKQHERYDCCPFHFSHILNGYSREKSFIRLFI